jgi:hypothetical protein
MIGEYRKNVQKIIEYEYTVGDKEPVKFEGTPQGYPDKSIQIHMEDESCARSVMTGQNLRIA